MFCNRRVFLTSATASALVITNARTARAFTIIALFRDLMFNVGARVITRYVDDYIDSWPSAPFSMAAASTNAGMVGEGFTVFDDSTLYDVESDEYRNRSVTSGAYAVQTDDRNDLCVPFLQDGRMAQLLEGPAVTGLSFAAEDLDLRSDLAMDWMVPRFQIADGRGSFSNTYDRPAEYESDRGLVQVDYENTYKQPTNRGEIGEGTVSVQLRDKDTYRRLYAEDFPITYERSFA